MSNAGLFHCSRLFGLALIYFWLTSSLFYFPRAEGSNILLLVPFIGRSHRLYFETLAEALANRNHKVTLISFFPSSFNNSNVKEIQLKVDVPPRPNLFHTRREDPLRGFQGLAPRIVLMAKQIYDIPEIQDVYNKREEFDMVLIDELFSESLYPFLAGRRYISVACPGTLGPSSAILGNVLNPSFIPGMTYDYQRPYSLLDRIHNLFTHFRIPFYWRKQKVFPEIDKIFQEIFPNQPPLAEIERGLSLTLTNTYFALDIPMPLLPSQIEVGGLHCRPPKELPQDLKQFMDASKHGVIYFSLGSICPGFQLPEKYMEIIMKVFKSLPYDVLWKYEESLPNGTPKILTRKWMPQQDILGHSKVKLFINHGGLLSMQESIFHEKPLLALPIFAEQERNSYRIRRKEFGDFILWEDLTEDKLLNAIKTIIEDPKYMETVKRTSAIFRDQPETPLERAVWWTEYVIRHKGAPQLHSPAADLSWIEYLMIDIIFCFCVAIFVLVWFIKKCICYLISQLFYTTSGKGTDKKKRL